MHLRSLALIVSVCWPMNGILGKLEEALQKAIMINIAKPEELWLQSFENIYLFKYTWQVQHALQTCFTLPKHLMSFTAFWGFDLWELILLVFKFFAWRLVSLICSFMCIIFYSDRLRFMCLILGHVLGIGRIWIIPLLTRYFKISV